MGTLGEDASGLEIVLFMGDRSWGFIAEYFADKPKRALQFQDHLLGYWEKEIRISGPVLAITSIVGWLSLRDDLGTKIGSGRTE